MKNHRLIPVIMVAADLVIAVLFSVYMKLPGVYFDSAITDYIASTLIHPEIDNQTGMMMSHVGIPLLGSIYHGTLSMFLQCVVLSLFHGSVWTLRFVYVIYVICCADLIFVFLIRVTGSIRIAMTGLLLAGTNVAVLTITRTQYDIMLPGTVFCLICTLLIWQMIIDASDSFLNKAKWLFIMGICLGIAFYDYFSFIFLAPVLVILAWKYCGGHPKYGICAAIWGFLLGCSLYFCGYADSFLTNIAGQTITTRVFYGSFCVLLYIVLGIPAVYILRKREVSIIVRRIYGLGIVIGLITVLVISIMVWHMVYEKLGAVGWSGVTARGQNKSIGDRLVAFFVLFYDLTSGRTAEQQINGAVTSVFTGVYYIVFMAIMGISVIMATFRKHRTELSEMIRYMLLFYLAFYICSLPISANLQPQHFVPLLFMSFEILPMCIFYLQQESRQSDNGKNMYAKHRMIINVIGGIAISAVIILNINDLSNFYGKLVLTGGRGAYSQQLNCLFESAYEESLTNQTVYFMVNPGIVPSFIYMTDNHIKVELLYGTDGKEEDEKIQRVSQYLNRGYSVYLLSVYEDFPDVRQKISDVLNVRVSDAHIVLDQEGNLAYSRCRIDN